MLVIVFGGSVWARGGDFYFLVIMDEVRDVRDCLAEVFHEDWALSRRVLPVMVENSYEEFWVWDFQPRCDDFGGLEIEELRHVG